MYQQQNILDADDYRRKKINFWFLWTAGNALGAAIGWALGETFGRITSETLGIRTGLLIATLTFEISVWLPRITISRYFKELNLLGYLEMMIWMITEVAMCVIVDLLPPNDVTWLTLGAGIANVMGATMSMLFSVIGLSEAQFRRLDKRRKAPSWWVIKTSFKAILGFIGITILFFTILTISTEIGKKSEMFLPVFGWALSGLLFGGGIGATTGFRYTKMVSQQDRILS